MVGQRAAAGLVSASSVASQRQRHTYLGPSLYCSVLPAAGNVPAGCMHTHQPALAPNSLLRCPHPKSRTRRLLTAAPRCRKQRLPTRGCPCCPAAPLPPPAAQKAMRIASDSCIYTNDVYTSLHIDSEGKVAELDIKAAAGSSGASGGASSGSGSST